MQISYGIIDSPDLASLRYPIRISFAYLAVNFFGSSPSPVSFLKQVTVATVCFPFISDVIFQAEELGSTPRIRKPLFTRALKTIKMNFDRMQQDNLFVCFKNGERGGRKKLKDKRRSGE